jgi:hypothetical protein
MSFCLTKEARVAEISLFLDNNSVSVRHLIDSLLPSHAVRSGHFVSGCQIELFEGYL